MKLTHKLIVITALTIALGYMEAAVVVYLREILYPDGFSFPLSPITPHLALTELFREVATLIILVCIGRLSGKRFSTGFAWFLYSFAIWDIFYYVFLWLILGWPASLMTWDVLFLIPTTWTGPVLTPVLVALSMILFAVLILLREERGVESRLPGKLWLVLILGSLVLVFAWILDYSRHMLERFSVAGMMQVENPEVLEWATTYVPGQFPWGIWFAGWALILGGIAWYGLSLLPGTGSAGPGTESRK